MEFQGFPTLCQWHAPACYQLVSVTCSRFKTTHPDHVFESKRCLWRAGKEEVAWCLSVLQLQSLSWVKLPRLVSCLSCAVKFNTMFLVTVNRCTMNNKKKLFIIICFFAITKPFLISHTEAVFSSFREFLMDKIKFYPTFFPHWISVRHNRDRRSKKGRSKCQLGRTENFLQKVGGLSFIR